MAEGDFSSFAASYLKVQTKTKGLQPLVQWPVQRELWETRRAQGITRSIIVKYRQGGFTREELGEGLFYVLRHPDTNFLVMGHEKALPTEMLDVIRLFIRFMPVWMQPHIGRDSAVEVYFDQLRSSIRVGSGATVMEGAGAKLGRTVQKLHVTEAADPRWTDDALNMLFQTVPLECEITVESTPKGARGWFYEEYGRAKAGNSTFSPFFFEWWRHPEYKMRPPAGFQPNERERWLIDNKGLTLAQACFRRYKVNELRNERAFLELYPEDDSSCFLLSGAGFFDPEALRYQLATPGCVAGAFGLRGRVVRDYSPLSSL